MENGFKSLQIFAKELVSCVNTIIDKRNLPVIYQGRIKEVKENNIYVVTIDNIDYEIKSKISFVQNDLVGVLTNYKMTGDKYLLS